MGGAPATTGGGAVGAATGAGAVAGAGAAAAGVVTDSFFLFAKNDMIGFFFVSDRRRVRCVVGGESWNSDFGSTPLFLSGESGT
jgi:hypothetical protein